MIEKVYNYSVQQKGIVEKLVDTKDVSIAHAIVEPDGSFPKHTANANVKIILVQGTLSAKFNDNDAKQYSKGNIISVPEGTEMEIKNIGEESLEFFAIKAPSPTYKP